MSKKSLKTQMRKLNTRAAVEKKRAKQVGHDYMSLSIADDYYATADHFSYDDLNDLIDIPERYSGKV